MDAELATLSSDSARMPGLSSAKLLALDKTGLPSEHHAAVPLDLFHISILTPGCMLGTPPA